MMLSLCRFHERAVSRHHVGHIIRKGYASGTTGLPRPLCLLAHHPFYQCTLSSGRTNSVSSFSTYSPSPTPLHSRDISKLLHGHDCLNNSVRTSGLCISLRLRRTLTSHSRREINIASTPTSRLYIFNRARRKNVSYFRGRSPWRNVSQSQRLADKKPVPNAVHEASVLPTSKSLLDRLPDMSQRFHRPTKDELLAAATGFWSRLRIRFKWFSIRSLRPFNMDDISAFFSWILVGHVIWILVGTTTFFSLVIFAINTVFAQGKSCHLFIRIKWLTYAQRP